MPDQKKESVSFSQPEKAPEAGKIKVKLICPLFLVTEVVADKVLLPGEKGNILILPDRAPIFLSLRAGRMLVYRGDKVDSYLISSGVCEFRRNLCPVLAWGGLEEKIDPYQIALQLTAAGEAIDNAHSFLARNEIASRIEFFKMILSEKGYQPEAYANRHDKMKRLSPELFGSDFGKKV